jgi:hypothetical protein
MVKEAVPVERSPQELHVRAHYKMISLSLFSKIAAHKNLLPL